MAAIKSIEEKAKAYDEALERAKELLEVGLKDTRDKRVVLSFFPELAESEDERIRKDIISYLKSSTAVSPKTWIEWLEKQGEQKSTDKVELMPTWSKEDERDFDVIYGIIYNSCNAEDASRLIEWLKSLKDRVQPQPQQQWSEEDNEIRNELIRHFESLTQCITTEERHKENRRWLNWLKSLKDRVQPKQEWSNWDKTIIESIEALCDEKIESVVFQDVKEHVNDIKDWLKSLRPQSTWKPSDAQMASITCAVRKMKESACYDSELVSLFNDLKKLKG